MELYWFFIGVLDGDIHPNKVHAKTQYKISILTDDLMFDYLATISKEVKADKKSLDFTIAVLNHLQKLKQNRIITTLQKFSRIPVIKRLDTFDFSFQTSINKDVIERLATLGFVHTKENVLFISHPGMGKSHLAVALGEECIEHGIKTNFFKMRDFIDKLKKAKEVGKYTKVMSSLRKASCLIIDEVGYRHLNEEETEIFFDIVDDRYETGSIILTTNYPLSS